MKASDAMSENILYHGSKEVVELPEIRIARYNKDFYFGFYCTRIEAQASRWATRFTGEGYINRYNYEPDASLNMLSFPEMTEEWLDFVMSNRQDIHFTYDYDVVMGAVANDNVYESLNLYEAGFLSKRELLEELMTWKYVDQICFHTEKALHYLRFLKSEEVFK